MVVAKVNASQFMQQKDKEQEESLITQINARMLKQYDPGYVDTFVVPVNEYKGSVVARIKATYEIAGWTVEEEDIYPEGKVLQFS